MPYVSNIQNSTDTFKAKSIVQHEICHCTEIKQLYDSKCLQKMLASGLNKGFTHTKPIEQGVCISSLKNVLSEKTP